MSKNATSRTPVRTARRAEDLAAVNAVMSHTAAQARRPLTLPANTPPKPVTPIENQLLQLASLAEETQNALHSIIDPLLPILSRDPREEPGGAELASEDSNSPLEAQIIRLKEHFRANLSRLCDIHDAIRL